MTQSSMSLEQADQIVQKLWAEDVKVWEAQWTPTFRKFAKDLNLAARLSPGQIVLDIGTGTGVAVFEAAGRTKPDGFVFGIDRLESMLTAAKANPEARRLKNVRFILMDSQRLLFPDQMFDVVVSNCGISPVGFRQTIWEVYRVLGGGGTLVYSDWRLRDVPAHRIFGDILHQHRTQNPSTELRLQRTALATLERFGNREMNLDEQIRQLRMMGFKKIEVKNRSYRIALRGIRGYLDMRLKRATLKQELKELSAKSRQEFRRALNDELRQFVRGERFLFDWKVIFVRAEKA
jgi:ubiquinone/menaquinone biosynthesis C-methylase UbiE